MNNKYKANLLKQLHNSPYNWNKYALFGWFGRQLNSAADAVGDAASAVGNVVGDAASAVGNAASRVGRQFIGESDLQRAMREHREAASKQPRLEQAPSGYRWSYGGSQTTPHKQTPTPQATQVKQTPVTTPKATVQATTTTQAQTPTPTPTPQATSTGQQTGNNSAVNTILNYRPTDTGSSYNLTNPMAQHMNYEQSDDEFMKEYEQANNIPSSNWQQTQQTGQQQTQQTGQQQPTTGSATQQTQLRPGLLTRAKNWWNNRSWENDYRDVNHKKIELERQLEKYKKWYAEDPRNSNFDQEAQARIQRNIDALAQDLKTLEARKPGSQTVKTSSVCRMTKRAHFRANGLRLIGQYIREENNK